MPSPAIPAGTLARMRSGHQAVRWQATLGLIYQFRAYCCDINSDGIMGVEKQPVVVLDLDPNPLCLGDTLTWDLRNSYAPGSTILAGGYSIDMGDSTQYFTDNGTHVYVAIGTYTIIATVEEGAAGGRSQTIEAEVEVIDCDDALLASFAYASLDGDGVWFIDFTVDAPTWTQRSGGLDGTALNVNSIALRPGDKRLPDTVHELYAATDDGLYFSYTGGRSWGKINLPNPTNTIGDVPAPTVGQLDFHKVVYSRQDPYLVWVLASKTTPDRMWVYRTEDGNDSWTSRGVVTT